MIDYARDGDTIVVTKLDRLARSMRDFCNIVADLERFGVGIKILSIEGLDTGNPTGKMILGVLASIAEFERELIRERQQDGIEKAKKEGRYKGRKPLSRDVRRQVYELLDDGCTKSEIARELGIGRSSVYNFIAQRKEDKAA
jgi:DNA invertase Pin-like site-specific DNA recombinase